MEHCYSPKTSTHSQRKDRTAEKNKQASIATLILFICFLFLSRLLYNYTFRICCLLLIPLNEKIYFIRSLFDRFNCANWRNIHLYLYSGDWNRSRRRICKRERERKSGKWMSELINLCVKRLFDYNNYCVPVTVCVSVWLFVCAGISLLFLFHLTLATLSLFHSFTHLFAIYRNARVSVSVYCKCPCSTTLLTTTTIKWHMKLSFINNFQWWFSCRLLRRRDRTIYADIFMRMWMWINNIGTRISAYKYTHFIVL